MKPLDLGKWGRMWSALCGGTGEIVQAPQTQRAGCCLLRAGTVAYTEISALACAHIYWADLVVTLYRKGYLLKMSQISRYSLPWLLR